MSEPSLETSYSGLLAEALDRGITETQANHMLNLFDAGGYEPGQFNKQLFKAIANADVVNSERLYLGFPEYVWLHNIIANKENGLQVTRTLAGSAGNVLRTFRLLLGDITNQMETGKPVEIAPLLKKHAAFVAEVEKENEL